MKTLAVVALLCSGCTAALPPPAHGPLSHYTIRIGTAWLAQPPVVLDAADDWTASTGVTFDFQISDTPCTDDEYEAGCFRVILSTPGAKACGPDAVGCTGRDTAIAQGLSPTDLTHTLRHELGHELGLVHVPDPGQLMYPTLGGTPYITAGDVAQYRAVRIK